MIRTNTRTVGTQVGPIGVISGRETVVILPRVGRTRVGMCMNSVVCPVMNQVPSSVTSSTRRAKTRA